MLASAANSLLAPWPIGSIKWFVVPLERLELWRSSMGAEPSHMKSKICCVVLMLISLPVGIGPTWVIHFLDLDGPAQLCGDMRGVSCSASA